MLAFRELLSGLLGGVDMLEINVGHADHGNVVILCNTP